MSSSVRTGAGAKARARAAAWSAAPLGCQNVRKREEAGRGARGRTPRTGDQKTESEYCPGIETRRPGSVAWLARRWRSRTNRRCIPRPHGRDFHRRHRRSRGDGRCHARAHVRARRQPRHGVLRKVPSARPRSRAAAAPLRAAQRREREGRISRRNPTPAAAAFQRSPARPRPRSAGGSPGWPRGRSQRSWPSCRSSYSCPQSQASHYGRVKAGLGGMPGELVDSRKPGQGHPEPEEHPQHGMLGRVRRMRSRQRPEAVAAQPARP
jgi:hypothetical protein